MRYAERATYLFELPCYNSRPVVRPQLGHDQTVAQPPLAKGVLKRPCRIGGCTGCLQVVVDNRMRRRGEVLNATTSEVVDP